MSLASTSGAMAVNTDRISPRMSLWVVISLSLLQDFGLLEQIVDRGQEQRATVTGRLPGDRLRGWLARWWRCGYRRRRRKHVALVCQTPPVLPVVDR